MTFCCLPNRIEKYESFSQRVTVVSFITEKRDEDKGKQKQRTKYLKSPLNYVGGKYKLLPQIMPFFPTKIRTFVDLFAGGCNVAINVKADKVVCNDINSKIIAMYESFQQHTTEEIIGRIDEKIRHYALSKENEKGYIAFRKFYNEHKNPIDLYTLTCFSFNYQFRFNNNLEYNNPFGRNRSQFSESMRNNLLAFLERIKSGNISFSVLDFEDYDFSKLTADDMVYCDPPYLITTGSYNDGNRGFKDWKEKQEHALYAQLDKLNQKRIRFALSNVLVHKGMHNEVLSKWCKKYTVRYVSSDYSNSSYNSRRGESKEVLITNY